MNYEFSGSLHGNRGKHFLCTQEYRSPYSDFHNDSTGCVVDFTCEKIGLMLGILGSRLTRRGEGKRYIPR